MSDQYLRNALSKYRYQDVAHRDVANCLTQFTDLKPKLDNFVFPDGTTKEMLQLDGTIPVTYKGNTYNIPVSIWLVDTHPYNPPICYVKPTSTMQIKASKHVDMNGKVYLPYLHEWKHPTSDLMGLIQIMCIVFGETPPVYSKASPPQAGQQQPPYPTGGYMAMPQLNRPSYGQSPSYGSTQYPGSYMQPPYPTNSPYSGTGSYPYPPSTVSSYPSATTYQTTYSNASSYQQSTNPYYTSPNTATNTNTVTEEHLRASLLSAVEDKMRRRLKEIFAQSQAEMDALKKTQEDLNKGKENLEEIIGNLEKEQHDVTENISLLKDKMEDLKQVLTKMEQQDQVDIDEAVVTTAPLYRQLLTAFADENATQDAIYYLGEALRKGVIEIDVFLKHVRELSRKQFMLRALMKKCREKAGLSEVVQPMRVF